MTKKQLRTFGRELVNHVVVWEKGPNPDFPWTAEAFGHQCKIRLNDPPDEPAYTLFIDEEEVGDLESWPNLWTRPLPG